MFPWGQPLRKKNVQDTLGGLIGDRWDERGLLWLWDKTTKTRTIICCLQQGAELVLRQKGNCVKAAAFIRRDGYEDTLLEGTRLDLREPTDVQGWLFAALSAYDREIEGNPWEPHPRQKSLHPRESNS